MRFVTRSVSCLGLAAIGVSSALAQSATAMGGADNQTWVLSTGSDISYFTENQIYSFTSELSGTGTGSATNTMNNPPGTYPTGGGTYYNTNGTASVTAGGSAYEQSGTGQYYFFSNSGSSAEDVTLGWQGLATASATASSSNIECFDYASSYIIDAETNTYAESVSLEASSPTTDHPGFLTGQGTYTFSVAPGQMNYEILTIAYNEALVAPEPAPYVALGVGALGLMLRRRKAGRSRRA